MSSKFTVNFCIRRYFSKFCTNDATIKLRELIVFLAFVVVNSKNKSHQQNYIFHAKRQSACQMKAIERAKSPMIASVAICD